TLPAETTASIEENKLSENQIPEPVTTTPSSTSVNVISTDLSVKKHYLVAGVFKVSENAQGLLLNLQQLGFSDAQVIEANGMHYVTYFGFTRFSQAVAFVDSLREKNLDGWVWR